MSNFNKEYPLFTSQEETIFMNYVRESNWTEATNIAYAKIKPICISVVKRAGRIFEGRFIELNDFLHDQWLNIFQYLSSENDYMEANSPLGYTIKHIQKYTLTFNSNDNKNVHLFQDTRYAGSQRIPYKRSIRGKEYHEYSATSLESTCEYSDNDDDCSRYEDISNKYESKWLEKTSEEITFNQNNKNVLTKDMVINMIYMQIGDINNTLDITELKLPNEPAMFLTNEERER